MLHFKEADELSFPEFCTRISCKAVGQDSIVLLEREEALGHVDQLFLRIRVIDSISTYGRMLLVVLSNAEVIEFSFYFVYSDRVESPFS